MWSNTYFSNLNFLGIKLRLRCNSHKNTPSSRLHIWQNIILRRQKQNITRLLTLRTGIIINSHQKVCLLCCCCLMYTFSKMQEKSFGVILTFLLRLPLLAMLMAYQTWAATYATVCSIFNTFKISMKYFVIFKLCLYSLAPCKINKIHVDSPIHSAPTGNRKSKSILCNYTINYKHIIHIF